MTPVLRLWQQHRTCMQNWGQAPPHKAHAPAQLEGPLPMQALAAVGQSAWVGVGAEPLEHAEAPGNLSALLGVGGLSEAAWQRSGPHG